MKYAEVKPKTVTLKRFAYTEYGTFGDLILPSGIKLVTVERPWLDNKPNISCIPNGEYGCSPRPFYRGGYDAVEVKDVPNRTYILFHIANFPREVNGCIGVNSRHGYSNDEMCGWGSRDAFKLFMSDVGHEPFNLVITNKVGGIINYDNS